jgi:hypothetical protein
MRELAIAACVLAAGCAGRGGNADSTAARDSVIVSGPPAVPSSLTPTDTSKVPPAATAPSGGKSTAPPARPTTPATPPATTTDSVRGIVSVVGTSFDKRVMVAPGGSGRRVEITGKLASIVGHVAGADVSVVGRMSGTQLEATSFVVRTVDGQPAIDGILRTEAGVTYIVSADGTRTRIAAPPPPLQGKDGARVWITGDPAKSVASFGFIDPPR